ncbi:MAG: protein-tyrosine phosphatase [Cyclobacteriaceae bacterium]|jgi:protein-tyrosine phosphatase
MWITNLFAAQSPSLGADMHAHLIPGVDDGCKTTEESISLIRGLADLGYKRLVATPHVYDGVYPNSESDLVKKFDKLKKTLIEESIDINIELGAEYFVDGNFLEKIRSDKDLLCFGQKKYLLIETAFVNASRSMPEVLFELFTRGYQPILAHPERYLYLHENIKQVQSWREQGLYMQLNIPSLLGYYGPAIKTFAKKLIINKFIDFLGSDIHSYQQLESLKKRSKSKLFRQACVLVDHNHNL